MEISEQLEISLQQDQLLLDHYYTVFLLLTPKTIPTSLLDFSSVQLSSSHYPLLNSSTQTIKSPLSNNFTASLTINTK